MKILKLINEIPYLLFGTVFPLMVFSLPALLFSSVLDHTDSWWLLIAVPLTTAILGFLWGISDLRKRGLNYSTTMGELTEAMKRDGEVPTRAGRH
jgi:hypothetical protein